MSASRISPVSFLKLSAEVSSFYGFRPLRDIERAVTALTKKDDRLKGREMIKPGRLPHSFVSAGALSTSYAAFHPQEPVLTFYATANPSHMPLDFAAKETGEFGLQVVGTSESVGEVILIKTISTIFTEWGTPLVRVRVNALGDRDSQQRFSRELGGHVRKHLHRVEEPLQKELLANPFALYRKEPTIFEELRAEAPRSINFLSERSRVHFRSVLEHLENLGLPYELDDTLMGDERTQHVTFAIDTEGEDATVISALGGRFDDFLRAQGKRKDSVGVGASIFFRKKGANARNFAYASPPAKPRVYFAQLGLKAKLRGLVVIDMLRQARVPVLQTFDATRLGLQLTQAQQGGVSHLIIMGQREALDGTVIVRSMKNSAQSTLSIAEIPRFLKTLR